MGKDSLFNKWCHRNGIFTYKKMKLNLYQSPHIKRKNPPNESKR
jgi:hypothetical protein